MIETQRLLLRPVQLNDFERWAEMMADERTARFIGGLQEKPVVWRSLMSVAGAYALTGVALFSVIEKKSGKWIGRVGPWHPWGWPGREIGWALHHDAWGQGFAYEAAVATMHYAFDVLDWTDVIHSIHPDNEPSQRLAARLGSVNSGRGKLPAPYTNDPVDIWTQTRTHWRASMKPSSLEP